MAANSSVGQELATAINLYSDTMADNITNNNPFTAFLRKKGNVKPADGGNKIEESLMYAENGTAKWYSGSEVLDTTNQEVLDAATYDWKQLNGNVTLDGLEKIKNSGKSRKHNLYSSKIKVLEISLSNELGSAIFGAGTAYGGKIIGGLQQYVADDPTSGTVGGIDRSVSTNSWWRNQVVDMSTDIGAIASATNIKAGMQKLWLRTTRMSDNPDIVIMDDDYFTYYDNTLTDNQRFVKSGEADGSFESYRYKGAMVYYDESCPDKHAYFLNSKYIFLREFPDRRFTVDEEIKIAGQDAIVVPIYWAGNLTMSNAALQGVLKD